MGRLFGVGAQSGGDPGGGYLPPVGFTLTVLDDFEDGNIDEYAGDTAVFQVVESPAWHGNYGLASNGVGNGRMYRGDLAVPWGCQLNCHFYRPGAGEGAILCGFLFGCTDEDNCYEISANMDSPLLTLSKIVASGKTTLDSAGFTMATETHERVKIEWDTDGSMVVTFADVELTATDTTYEGGGIGWSHNCPAPPTFAAMDYALERRY